MTRTHCKKPDACAAAKPTTHCRACAAAKLRADPEINARRAARLKAALSDPAIAQKRIATLHAAIKARCNDPAFIEHRRALGRRAAREVLNRPDVRAKSNSPEARAKAGRAHSEKVLGWCPIEYRDEYRRLVHQKSVKAVEARRMIEEMIEADQRRYFATGQLQQARRAA